VPVSGAQATFSTTSLSVGSHTVSAFYSGDGNFLGSSGNDSANPQVVNPGPSAAVTAAPTAIGAFQFLTRRRLGSASLRGTNLDPTAVDHVFEVTSTAARSQPLTGSRRSRTPGQDWLGSLF